MDGYRHLHKIIHDDVKDMEMLCDYAEDATKRGDKRLARHFVDRAMERRRAMEQSMSIMATYTEHHTESEKMIHECMVNRLEEDMNKVDEALKELRREL